MLTMTVHISTNKYTRVTTCTDESSYLIIIPKYYFKEDIEYWIFSEVGCYYQELLTHSSQDKRAIFIFNSHGDSQDNILTILEFMQHNKEDCENLFYTFTQCLICNELGTLKQKFTKFNFIQNGICENCTNLQ